jgi:uncharacterized membrane protein
MPALPPKLTEARDPTEQTLAGQPQDPPWRSAEQDQARPAWQTPAAPPSDKQDTYAYPQTVADQGYGQSYAQPGQSYGQPQQGQGYPGSSYTAPDASFPGQGQSYQDQAYPGPQDQAYPGPQDQAYPGPQDQAYPGPQDQAYPGPQGQSAPRWQGAAGMSAAAMNSRAAGHAKGFVGSLFDFSFTSFVTPKIVKVLYVLITIWTVIWALIFLRLGFKYGGAAGGFFTLIVVDPILVLLTLGVYRVVLEFVMVVHRMHEDIKALRERSEKRD